MEVPNNEDALELIENRIKRALEQNDARTVDYYHLFRETVETHTIEVHLRNMNQPALNNVIEYLKRKLYLSLNKLLRYDTIIEQ